MQLKDLEGLGNAVELHEYPFGILAGDGVVFATAGGRHYVNTSGSPDGFEEVDEDIYADLLGAFARGVPEYEA